MSDTNTQPESRADLKPCPFCGSDPITEPHEEFYTVTCSQDACVLGNMAISKAAWNTRAARASSPAVPSEAVQAKIRGTEESWAAFADSSALMSAEEFFGEAYSRGFDAALDHVSRPTWVRVEDAKVGIRYWVTYQEYSEPPSVRIGMMDDDGLWSFPYVPGLKVGKNFIKAILPYTEPSPFIADSKGDERC